MSKINIKIEGIPFQVDAGLTILEAAKQCGFEIPSLCAFNHGECSQASCRVCLVEVKGARGLVASCVYPISEGMEISISSPKAVAARRVSVELLLSNHNRNCQECDKNGKCELLHVAKITGAKEDRYVGAQTPVTKDFLTPTIVRDTSKCVLCGRCVARCKTLTASVSWALKTEVSRPSSLPPKTEVSSTRPVLCAVNVSTFVLPAL